MIYSLSCQILKGIGICNGTKLTTDHGDRVAGEELGRRQHREVGEVGQQVDDRYLHTQIFFDEHGFVSGLRFYNH